MVTTREIANLKKAFGDGTTEDRVALAAKLGAIACVSAVIAAASLHLPSLDEATVLTAPMTDTAAAAQAPANGTEAKPYYFPSEYELRATEPAESAPTF